PISQAYEFYSALKHYGAPVEMVVYPREPHGIGEYAHQIDLLNRVLAWFKQHDVK
ncbi:MAG: prolyl oligopeptidase family serine peptidase, partial [Candidatus Aminicenantes bacterium]|nr:prolyl oligopeptidase family serine peptidase [Candidatus Aminicenantes bacterium]